MDIERPAPLYWLWLPFAVMIAQIVIEFTVPKNVYEGMMTENGPLELLEFFVLATALASAVIALRIPALRAHRGLAAWVGLAALCCFYVAGEEISWGQHFLSWTTPEYWATVNDQAETNLHNTSSWLDQKPRLLLEVGVITGGLLLPGLLKIRRQWIPGWLAFITPPPYLAVTAALFLFVRVADVVADLGGPQLFKRASEVGEIYLFYFVLLYLRHMGGIGRKLPANA